MQLWFYWWDVMSLLRPAFSRTQTFMWFAVSVAGLTVRSDHLGVTSIIRALGLDGEHYYDHLLDNFHSTGIKLDSLTAIWAQIVLRMFPGLVRFKGRLVLVGDGIKAAKEGVKMPGVKLLHQESEGNTKPEYIMGHSFQAVSILSRALGSIFAIPLIARIHEGIVETNRDKRTLLDKMMLLLPIVGIQEPYYFVADAYYACGKVALALLEGDNHLVTRVRTTAVAWTAYVHKGQKKRGRPRLYGQKIKLKSLFKDNLVTEEALSPVYGETDVVIRFSVHDLLWRPVGQIVRFVIVIHPTRGRCILMSTDTSLSAADIIHIYGLRFKIEFAFKQSVHVFGGFSYHFWMKVMKPLKRRNGNQFLHREPDDYRKAVKRKINAYHVYVQAGIIAQGLVQYLAACHPKGVWDSFGSWLRTIRPGLAPSEFVVTTALRNSLPEFLLDKEKGHILAKFIVEKQDPKRSYASRFAA